jgi:hypothetical protein
MSRKPSGSTRMPPRKNLHLVSSQALSRWTITTFTMHLRCLDGMSSTWLYFVEYAILDASLFSKMKHSLSLRPVNLLSLALFTQGWLDLDTIKALTLSSTKRRIIVLIASLWTFGVGIMFFVLMIFALSSGDSIFGLLY